MQPEEPKDWKQESITRLDESIGNVNAKLSDAINKSDKAQEDLFKAKMEIEIFKAPKVKLDALRDEMTNYPSSEVAEHNYKTLLHRAAWFDGGPTDTEQLDVVGKLCPGAVVDRGALSYLASRQGLKTTVADKIKDEPSPNRQPRIEEKPSPYRQPRIKGKRSPPPPPRRARARRPIVDLDRVLPTNTFADKGNRTANDDEAADAKTPGVIQPAEAQDVKDSAMPAAAQAQGAIPDKEPTHHDTTPDVKDSAMPGADHAEGAIPGKESTPHEPTLDEKKRKAQERMANARAAKKGRRRM
jgi:hypothetical protein